MELKEIKELIALMKRNDLSVFKMEREGFKIVLKKGVDFQAAASPAPTQAAPAVSIAAATPASSGLKEINSPMVGTFYQAGSPEAPPFVDVGSVVTEDMVVCIIEAMKVMNEIKAETNGTIAEVMVENGKPVQFGQALFKVK